MLTTIAVLLLISSALCSGSEVYVGEVNGMIDPVVSQYVSGVINQAENANATAVVLVIDTPGGLDKSMRSIIKTVLASRVPVVGYVYPRGARAASAGSFILLATQIAAMSPGTNLGAAHPVRMSLTGETTVENKITQDAAAYMRAIAQLNGRNVSLAESFVLKSKSITEKEALKDGVINVVAGNIGELLNKINGKTVKLESGNVTLETSHANIVRVPMSTSENFLHSISNPNIAYLLFIAGIFGIIFELSSPGAIFPGVVGVICLLIALWSFQTISINYAGLILILFGFFLFLLEIKINSFGLLSIGGVISLVLGSLMLINVSKEPFISISYWSIGSVTLITALFFTFVIAKTAAAMIKKPETGKEGMLELIGETKTELSLEGLVFIHGELWKARTKNEKIERGRKVKVVGMENLTLIVKEVK